LKYRFGKKEYDFSSRTYVMGILNITPDSFSDGGKFFGTVPDMNKIIESAVQMEKDGADFIDVGGESTRPGADEVSLDKEIERVIPVISEITKRISIPVSIDTYKHQVADEALKAGAVIVNDISGFQFDDKIAEITGKHDASCILMHIKGTPKIMQNNPIYTDIIGEIITYLEKSVSIAKEAGIEQIILDPGIGFGKTFEDNLKIIKNLKLFRDIGYPVLLGASRKSFINKIYESSPAERLEGTLAANTAGIIYGANIIRVHDVLENKRAALTADNLK
jgi:dihydropteroate synthase